LFPEHYLNALKPRICWIQHILGYVFSTLMLRSELIIGKTAVSRAFDNT